MKIGILITGAPPPHLIDIYGDYGVMFRDLVGDQHDYVDYDVTVGQLPRPTDCDAYLITGSRAGVYEPLEWIPPFKAFLQETKGRAAIVGICFGHQIMAEVFGGKVVKADVGWGIGLHSYDIVAREPWMDAEGAPFCIAAMHQDQIVRMPPNARTLASSAFTPHAAVIYDDQPALTFQCHPEFPTAYASDLIIGRRGTVFAPDHADAAVESFERADSRTRVAAWIRQFLDAYDEHRREAPPNAR